MAADRIAEDNKKWKRNLESRKYALSTSGSYGKCF